MKDFVPYELALELKAIGFDEPCFGAYIGNELKIFQFSNDIKGYVNDANLIIGAPTFSQCFRWFREKYVLLGFIEPANGYEDKSLFAFYICDDEQNIINDEHSYSKDSSLHYTTYEEAELECLKKLIEIVKDENTK